MIDFEVFIGRTEQNRKKTYLVAEPGTTYISRRCRHEQYDTSEQGDRYRKRILL